MLATSLKHIARLLATAIAIVRTATAIAQPTGSLVDNWSVTEFAESGPEVDEPSTRLPIIDEAVEPANWFRHHCGNLAPDPSGGGFPTLKVAGLIQADAIWFSQDEVNKAVVGDAEDVGDFRRARLGVKGQVAPNVEYCMEYDFALPGRPNFLDVYIDFADLTRLGRLRIGQWVQPFGMDAKSSIKEIIFMERALPVAFVPLRQIGVGLYDTAFDESATWAVSVYRFPTDAYGSVAGDSGYGMSTRETLLLYEDQSGRTCHVGGGITYIGTDKTGSRIRSTPEVGFSQLDLDSTDFPIPFFVDTGSVPVSSYRAFNGELAGTRGPWFFQSELYYASADTLATGNVGFHGAYVQLAYCLTGETHPYHHTQGVYTRILPHRNYGPCGIGAWEVAGRLSTIDLNDGPIDGGTLNDFTLGVNWYVNQYTRFQFNYIHAALERPAAVDSSANIFAMRAQVDF